MAKPGVYLLIFDGLADWEPAHALTALRRWAEYDVKTIGFTRDAVVSMGGLRIVPDVVLNEVDPNQIALLILPGGDMWEDVSAYPRESLDTLLQNLEARGTPVAAICAATLAAARAGLLRDRRHTSNGRAYIIEQLGAYDGTAHYDDGSPAVTDRAVITASGLGSVEFAREILSQLKAFSPQDIDMWFDMYRHGRMPVENKPDTA